MDDIGQDWMLRITSYLLREYQKEEGTFHSYEVIG